MKQAHKKRSHEATANSPPVLADMGKLLYKSGKFAINKVLHIQFIYNQYSNIFNPLIKKQHRNKTETKQSIKANSSLSHFH